MFRKISIALVAAAALGSTALAPTSASALPAAVGSAGSTHRGFGFGYSYGPGWCYFHPYRCERPL
jgi:hypothetical protein